MRFHPAILSAAAMVLGAAAVFATPALAKTPASVGVAYSDLDLSTAAGQAALKSRLNKAAHRVCMFDEDGDLRSGAESASCYRGARREAAVQMAQLVVDRQFGG